jgi:hypothetical protein
MKKSYTCLVLLVIAIFLVDCRQKKHDNTAINVKQGVLTEDACFKKQQGSNFGLPNAKSADYAIISCVYPTVKNGSLRLQLSVERWATTFIASVLSGNNIAGISNTSNKVLDSAANIFFKTREKFKGSVMYNGFYAESTYKILYNSSSYITIAIIGNSFQGGAHNNPTAAVATFNTQSGNILKWGDIVANSEGFKKLVEKKLLVERADAFKDGFKFDEIFKFKLPDNYGLVKGGIYLHYLHYEIMPYALGSTSFVIPCSEIENLLKLKCSQ